MDERLLLGSLDGPALRMLLQKERAEREALAQEVARLRAGLARQNARLVALERENAQLRQMVALQQEMIAGLQDQNAHLRAQVAHLQVENARLAGRERPETLPGDRPQATPAKRIRRYQHELFPFVAVPGVPHTNDDACLHASQHRSVDRRALLDMSREAT